MEELAAVQTDLERADKTNNFQTCLQKNGFFDVLMTASNQLTRNKSQSNVLQGDPKRLWIVIFF